MKVVVNARFLTQPITGVQRFAIEISKGLKKYLQDDVVFIAPKGVIHEDLASELNVRIVGLNQSHLWEQIDLRIFLLKHNCPLLLNLCNTAPVFYSNSIITVHDVAFEVYPQTYSKKFLLLYKYLIPHLVHNAKKIITVSEFSKSEIIKFYNISADRIEVINNAVSTDFHPIENKNLQKQKYFLTVSSLNYRKNLKIVLEAFNLLSKNEEHVKLYIVGDLNDKAFSKYSLDDFGIHKNIVFLGRLSDKELMEYYSNSKAFIYPSLYEGFGIPPLEAQKCKTAVIVSDIPCFWEIFGNSVIYNDVHQANQLKDKMQLLLTEDFRLKFVIKGIENENRYSWEKSNKNILRLIKSCY